jgi:hypothetical protein
MAQYGMAERRETKQKEIDKIVPSSEGNRLTCATGALLFEINRLLGASCTCTVMRLDSFNGEIGDKEDPHRSQQTWMWLLLQ